MAILLGYDCNSSIHQETNLRGLAKNKDYSLTLVPLRIPIILDSGKQ